MYSNVLNLIGVSSGMQAILETMFRAALAASSLLGLSHQAALKRSDADNDNLPPLRFNEDGDFQISVFSDIHLGQSQSSVKGPLQDLNSQRVIQSVLDSDKPDLVVLNGDIINGDNMDPKNSTHYLDKAVSLLVDRNLTWASTYGNHDHQPSLDPEKILEREKTFKGSRTRKMVNDENAGTSNYYLPVYGPDCDKEDDCVPDLFLWFFDSRGGFYYRNDSDGGSAVDQPNWVDQSVVTWFNKAKKDLVSLYDKVIPSLAFVHIPIQAALAAQSGPGIDKHRQPGIDEETPVVPQSDGWCSNGQRGEDGDDDEKCSYGGQDLPFMQALVSTPGLIGLFYGHDHGNSWCYKWDSVLPGMDIKGSGIHLCYGQHSGYGGYGDWVRGGRQIHVNRDSLKDTAVDTYIRLETGDAVGRVTLNSTFNSDCYDSTPNTKTFLRSSNFADDSFITSNDPDESAAERSTSPSLAGFVLSLGFVVSTGLWLCI